MRTIIYILLVQVHANSKARQQRQPESKVTSSATPTSSEQQQQQSRNATIALPPVPADKSERRAVTDFNAFKETLPLHPPYWRFIDREGPPLAPAKAKL